MLYLTQIVFFLKLHFFYVPNINLVLVLKLVLLVHHLLTQALLHQKYLAFEYFYIIDLEQLESLHLFLAR
ncbi:hypothetical protein D3C72_1237470 [compost metagenome]